MYEIEKGIPLPRRNSPRKGKSKYPFAAMEVGDSFSVDSTTMTAITHASCEANKRMAGKRFAVRKVGNGFRVWRIK